MDILIADDDSDIRALVTMIVTSAGYRVAAYESGLLALAASRREGSTLYILDIQMPGVNGLDTCRHLRADPTTKHSRILLMSADTSPASVAAALDAGADEFLAKPFTRRELLSRIEHLVESPLPQPA